MAKHVAFLRAINVGGRVVKMDVLRKLFEELNFTQVETFIASGNVIFETRKSSGLETKIESSLRKLLGYEVATFIRTAEEMQLVARLEPFLVDGSDTAHARNVGLLKAPAPAEAIERFDSQIDKFSAHGRELYWLSRKKLGESKITSKALERAIGGPVTFRNTSTVEKIAAKLSLG